MEKRTEDQSENNTKVVDIETARVEDDTICVPVVPRAVPHGAVCGACEGQSTHVFLHRKLKNVPFNGWGKNAVATQRTIE